MEYISIGKNKSQNWEIIKDADPEDTWFHVEGIPSGHVILEADAPNDLIEVCARICKERSKAKEKNSKVSVVYTKVKNIRFGRHVGEVIIKDHNLCNYIRV